MTLPRMIVLGAFALALAYFAQGSLEYWDPEMVFTILASCGTIAYSVKEVRQSGAVLHEMQSEIDSLTRAGPEGWVDLQVKVGILAHRLDTLETDSAIEEEEEES